MLQKTFLVVSTLMLVSCAVKRPVGWICVYNAEAQYNACFDMKRDFDNEGRIKPGVEPQRVPMHTVQDFDNRINIDVDSFANLKAYLLKLKERCEAKQ